MFSPVDMLQRSFHVFLLSAEAHWIFLCRGSIVSSALIVWLEVRPDSGFLPIGQPTTEVSKHPIRRSVCLLYKVCHLRLTFETVLDFLLMGVNNDFPRPRWKTIFQSGELFPTLRNIFAWWDFLLA